VTLVRAGQLLLGLLAGGNVRLDTDEVGELAICVPYRGDGQSVPERSPVFAIVQNVDRADLAVPNSVSQARYCRRIGVRPLQEAAVALQGLVHSVAGETRKTLVGIDDRVVFLAEVGDRDALVGSVQRQLFELRERLRR
jgi:hypothetical protein